MEHVGSATLALLAEQRSGTPVTTARARIDGARRATAEAAIDALFIARDRLEPLPVFDRQPPA